MWTHVRPYSCNAVEIQASIVFIGWNKNISRVIYILTVCVIPLWDLMAT